MGTEVGGGAGGNRGWGWGWWEQRFEVGLVGTEAGGGAGGMEADWRWSWWAEKLMQMWLLEMVTCTINRNH